MFVSLGCGCLLPILMHIVLQRLLIIMTMILVLTVVWRLLMMAMAMMLIMLIKDHCDHDECLQDAFEHEHHDRDYHGADGVLCDLDDEKIILMMTVRIATMMVIRLLVSVAVMAAMLMIISDGAGAGVGAAVHVGDSDIADSRQRCFRGCW